MKLVSVKTDPWSRLRDAQDPEHFAAAWLEIQCDLLGHVQQAVVVLGPPDQGPFTPAAVWPEEGRGSPGLTTAIESVMASREPYRREGMRGSATHKNHDTLAYPLLVDNKLCGAVAVEIIHNDDLTLDQAAQQLEWGSAWLESLIRRKKLTSTERLVTVLELLATSLHYEKFQEAATAVATELANIFNCERVSIGFLKRKHVEVRALSNSAQFSKKANLIRTIEAVMDEAVDQHATIRYPAGEDGPVQVVRAHEILSRDHTTGPICTMPFTEGERILGAVTFERPTQSPFDERTIELCEHAASLLGPILEIKRRNDRLLIEKAIDSGREQFNKLTGPRHTALKIGVYSLLALLVFFIFAKGEYRITADATLEGSIQRVIAAPMTGYVIEADVRAGDIVKAGDVMFTLDERDLRLERLKWISQRSQRSREYSEALAEHDRAKAGILGAQIEQADAQIALIDEQLSRLRVVAPFDGYVVSGDLSQSLGAPVERGDVLFEVAPLRDYRIILEVDEREVGAVALDQPGQLILSGMPDEAIQLVVEKITPVSSAADGNNYFRVEAGLVGEPPASLRPGMQGVGKIDAGERKLIWIWTHKISHWLKMFFWSWWP